MGKPTADSSRAQLYMSEEVIWGEDPLLKSPRPKMKEVRFTGESLVHAQESVTSDEIRSDGQITDLVRVGVSATGDINYELSYGTFDRFFEGLMRNDWTAEIDVNAGVGSPTASVTVTTNTGASTVDVPGAQFNSILIGSWIQISGSAIPANNGYFLVTNNVAGLLTVTPGVTTEVLAMRVRGSHLKNGTTKKSYLIEKRLTDVSPLQFFYFTGMRVGSGSATIAPGEILKGALSFMGKRGFAQSSISAGLTDSAAPATDVANAVDNITNVKLDGVALVADLTQITFDVNNNTRPKPAVANLGNIDIGLGRFNVTGNITAYFSDRTLYDKYLAFTAHAWSFVVVVGIDSYLFNFPSIKFSNGTIVAEGNDGDIVANMDFQARRSPTYGFTMSIDRFSGLQKQDLN